MTSSEAWQQISSELAHEVLESACKNQKKLYRRVVNDLAANLRKRPNVILELPRADRHKLFHPLLGIPHFELLGQNLFMNWFGNEGNAVIVSFLDEMKIEHDGQGYADNFPEEVKDADVERAVANVYKSHTDGEEKVSLYLHLFHGLTGADWGVEKHAKDLPGQDDSEE